MFSPIQTDVSGKRIQSNGKKKGGDSRKRFTLLFTNALGIILIPILRFLIAEAPRPQWVGFLALRVP